MSAEMPHTSAKRGKKKPLCPTQFTTNGNFSPSKVAINRYMETELDILEDIKEARMSARLSKMKHHEHIRAQTSCSLNSYIKPKTLMNFSVDYSTFERF